jgi:hypothetical protein
MQGPQIPSLVVVLYAVEVAFHSNGSIARNIGGLRRSESLLAYHFECGKGVDGDEVRSLESCANSHKSNSSRKMFECGKDLEAEWPVLAQRSFEGLCSTH